MIHVKSLRPQKRDFSSTAERHEQDWRSHFIRRHDAARLAAWHLTPGDFASALKYLEGFGGRHPASCRARALWFRYLFGCHKVSRPGCLSL
jgi:hypothetical protein